MARSATERKNIYIYTTHKWLSGCAEGSALIGLINHITIVTPVLP